MPSVPAAPESNKKALADYEVLTQKLADLEKRLQRLQTPEAGQRMASAPQPPVDVRVVREPKTPNPVPAPRAAAPVMEPQAEPSAIQNPVLDESSVHARIDRLKTFVAQRSAQSGIVRTSIHHRAAPSPEYHVAVMLDSQQDRKRLVSSLQRQGVTGWYAPEGTNAVFLGTFQDREMAERRRSDIELRFDVKPIIREM